MTLERVQSIVQTEVQIVVVASHREDTNAFQDSARSATTLEQLPAILVGESVSADTHGHQTATSRANTVTQSERGSSRSSRVLVSSHRVRSRVQKAVRSS